MKIISNTTKNMVEKNPDGKWKMMELYKNIIFKHEMETKIGRKKKPSQIRRRAVVRLSSLRLNKQAESLAHAGGHVDFDCVALILARAWLSAAINKQRGDFAFGRQCSTPLKKNKKKQLTNDLKKGNDTNFAQIKKYKHKTTRPSGFLYKTFYK